MISMCTTTTVPASTHERRDPEENGQVMVLVIGYTLVCLLLVTVVMAASAVYIGHKKLLSVADSAALAAADSFALGDVSGAGGNTGKGAGGPSPSLTSETVHAAVSRYLQETSAASRFSRLAVEPATGTTDARTAQVVLTAVVHPPVVNFLIPDGLPVTAVADARSRFVQ